MGYAIDEINDMKAMYRAAVEAVADIRCLCTERPERLRLYQELTRHMIRVIRISSRIISPYDPSYKPRPDLEIGGVFS